MSVVCVGVCSALYRWQNWGYLKSKAGQVPVSVNVTPNGKGDAVLHTPHVRTTLTQLR